ncbi:MAG: hypothetical protein H6730_04090 [Deltaproteobacteria bacterium]|nr:hypothetical protein [Deltaproteobacteria bacterium]
MVRVGLIAALFAPLFASSGLAHAQEGEGADAPKVQSIHAVERGLFVEGDGGVTGFIVNTGDGDQKLGAATQLSVFGGYDVLPILSIGLGVTGLAAGGSPELRGDLFYVAPSLTARFAVLTTERDFLWLRADAGFGLALPGKIDGVDHGGAGVVGSVLVGYERFAMLRHLSIGANLGATLVSAPFVALGITFMPHVKYTF